MKRIAIFKRIAKLKRLGRLTMSDLSEKQKKEGTTPFFTTPKDYDLPPGPGYGASYAAGIVVEESETQENEEQEDTTQEATPESRQAAKRPKEQEKS